MLSIRLLRMITASLGFMLAIACLLAAPAMAQLPTRSPDRELAGGLTGADSATYQTHALEMPDGVSRLVVALGHDGDPAASLIELGLADSHGFRGASSKKTWFTISETDATPGYLLGRLTPGEWKVTFSVGILPKDKPTNWTLRVWFLKPGEFLPDQVQSRGPGWYRGDMHIHSGHSDGFCMNQTGQMVPCPLYTSIDTASQRSLDFVMLTEHNTVSHTQVIRELQPRFNRLLLIPGQEVTTFFGHFSVWGVDQPVDYRIAKGRTFNDVADDVHRFGGLISINHPGAPTGAMCLGCGFSVPDIDYSKVDGVEAVNGSIVGMTGGNAEGGLSAIPFWLDRLNEGHRITAIGGSDTHDGTAPLASPSTIGRPTTVVYADNLSREAILAGVKSGRVFVDIAHNPDALLDLTIDGGSGPVPMGGATTARTRVIARATVAAPAGSRLEFLDGATIIGSMDVGGEDSAATHELRFDLAAGRHPIRAQVRAANGRLILLSNAIQVTRE
jgi:hypothetical protein